MGGSCHQFSIVSAHRSFFAILTVRLPAALSYRVILMDTLAETRRSPTDGGLTKRIFVPRVPFRKKLRRPDVQRFKERIYRIAARCDWFQKNSVLCKMCWKNYIYRLFLDGSFAKLCVFRGPCYSNNNCGGNNPNAEHTVRVLTMN